nr:DUF3131 domain-containing protein [Sphaerospermopsis aphanizomenoides]
MNSDFEPPPKKLSILATVGGVVTAIVAITGLNSWSKQLAITNAVQTIKITPSPTPATKETDTIAELDTKSIVLPGQEINLSVLKISKTPDVNAGTGKLTDQELIMARQAWSYFKNNWNDQTGLVNSVDGFASVTMWDQAAAIAALVSARELNIITVQEFESKMSRMLKTLASMPLYQGELPNKSL